MRAIALILSVAVLWGVTGAIAGWGLQTYVGASEWVLSCGLLNVVIGMILLQLITYNQDASELFYEGRKPHEDYFNPILAFLLLMPFLLAFSGLLWWIMGRYAP